MMPFPILSHSTLNPGAPLRQGTPHLKLCGGHLPSYTLLLPKQASLSPGSWQAPEQSPWKGLLGLSHRILSVWGKKHERHFAWQLLSYLYIGEAQWQFSLLLNDKLYSRLSSDACLRVDNGMPVEVVGIFCCRRLCKTTQSRLLRCGSIKIFKCICRHKWLLQSWVKDLAIFQQLMPWKTLTHWRRGIPGIQSKAR